MIEMMIIDAKDLILGRMSALAAKKALLGEEIRIVNAEQAVITGKPKEILTEYNRRRIMGPALIGPFFPRTPERLVKRVVRGMLPYKNPRGKEALARVKCYVGVPEEFKKEKLLTFDDMNVNNSPAKFIRIKEISKQLGAKVE